MRGDHAASSTTHGSSFLRTFSPIDDCDKLLEKLEHVASELEMDMVNNGWTGRTITLKYKLDTYQGNIFAASQYAKLPHSLHCSLPESLLVFTRAKSLNRYVSSKEELFSVSLELLSADSSSSMPRR